MDKRSILAMGLILALLIVFQFYLTPNKEANKDAQKQAPLQQTAKETKSDGTPKTQSSPLESKNETVTKKRETKPAQHITVETPLLTATMSDLGGGITSVRLKEYKETVKGTAPKEIIEDMHPFVYIPKGSLKISKNSSLSDTDDMFIFSSEKSSITVTDKPEHLVFTGIDGNGTEIRKTYTFHPDSYIIDMNIEINGPEVKNVSYDFAVISNKKSASYIFKGPFTFNGKSLKQIDKVDKPTDIGKDYSYAGFDDGFFAFIWIPSQDHKPSLTVLKQDNIPILKLSGEKTISGKLYFGPKKTEVLKELNIRAEKIIDFGWFDIIAKPLILGLKYSNKITHNYGIDIILLTILIKLIFYPLTVKSSQSMKKMQGAQGKIAELRKKYANDKEKLNKEVMEYYRAQGINPLGGCLPMLIQIPVFFALYKGLSGAIELRHAPFMLWINDLSAAEDLFSFSVLGWTIPIRILPLVMGITQFIQQKMTPTATADPMQEKMMLFMPLVFLFIMWGFPSGLVLYWLVNNVISIGQQYYINKKMK